MISTEGTILLLKTHDLILLSLAVPENASCIPKKHCETTEPEVDTPL